MKSTFEKMGGTYTLGADGIYYPNLVSTDEEPHYGKYGMMRKTYLKEHRPAMYSLYMLEDRLVEHLNLVDDEAQERMVILVRQMMERQGIAEELKARDQMAWVRAVNGISTQCRKICDLVFCNIVFQFRTDAFKEHLFKGCLKDEFSVRAAVQVHTLSAAVHTVFIYDLCSISTDTTFCTLLTSTHTPTVVLL